MTTDTSFDAESHRQGSRIRRQRPPDSASGWPRRAAAGVADTARVDYLASKVVKSLNDIIIEDKVSYAEYNALKAWLIKVGEDGEWPLFLDVWLEHSVEEVASEHREGSKGTIEGPYYIEGSPELAWDGTIPMREDEPGNPLVFAGQVRAVDGTPLSGAKVELRHRRRPGFYSQFARSAGGNRAAPGSRTRTAATRSTRCAPPRTRSRPTARAVSSSRRPAGTPGVRPTCTSRSAHPATSSSPPSSTSRATRTTTTTSAGGEAGADARSHRQPGR